MLGSCSRFPKSEVAKERMKIIHFYEKYGENATLEAFGASMKVISKKYPKIGKKKIKPL